MDETMVRTFRQDQDNEIEDFKFLIEGFDEHFRVKLRPGLLEFLEDMSRHYRLAVFTAGKKAYARPILKHIDPQGKFFERMLFQHHCDQTTFAKDLTLIEKDLSNVVLLDNNPTAYSLQPRNGLPIIDFYRENDFCVEWKLHTFRTNCNKLLSNSLCLILKVSFCLINY